MFFFLQSSRSSDVLEDNSNRCYWLSGKWIYPQFVLLMVLDRLLKLFDRRGIEVRIKIWGILRSEICKAFSDF